MNKPRYIHTSAVHNTRAAELILPYVFSLIPVKSVIDVGCGIGTWLKVCLDSGITDIKGIDGDYVNREQLVIPHSHFKSHDLETPLNLERKFDLVISLEVAEHLIPEAAGTFIDTLALHGDIILFSAATKEQGGQNHLNEQEPTYWEKLFNEKGYHYYDLVRPFFWQNEDIEWWYRQNTFLVSKKAILAQPTSNAANGVKLYIHPELYYYKMGLLTDINGRYEKLYSGRESLWTYIKLLIKFIKNKFN